jgi:hypothetical protein
LFENSAKGILLLPLVDMSNQLKLRLDKLKDEGYLTEPFEADEVIDKA